MILAITLVSVILISNKMISYAKLVKMGILLAEAAEEQTMKLEEVKNMDKEMDEEKMDEEKVDEEAEVKVEKMDEEAEVKVEEVKENGIHQNGKNVDKPAGVAKKTGKVKMKTENPNQEEEVSRWTRQNVDGEKAKVEPFEKVGPLPGTEEEKKLKTGQVPYNMPTICPDQYKGLESYVNAYVNETSWGWRVLTSRYREDQWDWLFLWHSDSELMTRVVTTRTLRQNICEVSHSIAVNLQNCWLGFTENWQQRMCEYIADSHRIAIQYHFNNDGVVSYHSFPHREDLLKQFVEKVSKRLLEAENKDDILQKWKHYLEETRDTWIRRKYYPFPNLFQRWQDFIDFKNLVDVRFVSI